MKITLCGSIVFIDEMDALRKELELLGHTVKMPPLEVTDDTGKLISVKKYYAIRKSAPDEALWVWKRKSEAMREHFDKVAWADAILVANYDKKEVISYIGANTFLEMGLAFHLKKPIYLLHSIPEVSYREEILGMDPIAIHGDLKKIAHL